MKIAYNPGDTSKGQAAYAICQPENPIGLWWMWIHGVGERSDGTLENLKNLVEGFDYNRDGKREPSVIPSTIFEAVDKYGITLVIPTYKDFFEPAKVNAVYDHAVSKYQLRPQFVMDGFSLGGGATLRYATSNLENAKRLIVAIPVAPTRSGLSYSIPKQIGLPMHFFVNDNDDNDATNLEVTKACVTSLASSMVKFTAFRADGHGGVDKSHTLTAPITLNGQGVVNLTESVWEWAIDCYKNGPRLMKSGKIETPPPAVPTPPPIPTIPTEPTTPITREVIIDYTGTGPKFHVSGKNTKDWNKASKWQWIISAVPKGVNPYTVKFPGGGYIESDVEVPAKGQYVFKLIVTWPDQTSDDADITVNYGETQEPPALVITDITIKEGDIRLVFPNGKKYVTTSLKLEDIVNNYNLEEGKTTNYDEQD